MHLWHEEKLFFEPGDLGLPVFAAMLGCLGMTAAHFNGIYVAAADRVGTERQQPFLGHSVIVNPMGWPIAGPASPDKEEIIYADCNPVEARRARTLNDLNVLMRDRRTDVYDATLGTGLRPRAF